MSSDRTRLSKPARPPLTPRVAGSAASTPQLRPAAPRLPTGPGSSVGPGTPIISPRIASRPADETPKGPALGQVNANITPRSAKRKSRVDSSTNNSPLQDESPADVRPKSTNASTLGLPDSVYGRGGGGGGGGTGLGVSIGYGQNKAQARPSRPKSLVGAGSSPPLVRSPGYTDLSSQQESIESRFFHASDARRQEPPAKKLEPKRTPAFFYADGKEDAPSIQAKSLSPVMSAMSEKGPSAAWSRPDSQLNMSRNPPMSSPALSAAGSSVSSFFPATTSQQMRSPSPSKENIHLSYRKGASQIFGTRPTPRQAARPADLPLVEEARRPSVGAPHRKSPSLSSIDSGNSHASRRRSGTAVDIQSPASPLTQASLATQPVPRLGSPPESLPTIDTSLASSLSPLRDNGALSPTKNVSELAADARRERKVLDLEISNSSLMAINASLEREVRRQKTELKRFRRLSRAGRLSMAASELSNARSSGGLGTLGEDDDDEDNPFEAAMISGLVDLDDDDDVSDSEEDDSLMSSNDPLSPNAQQDRLAKDEKRLRVDLEKHKELLVVSQNINHSLKRCMYATEAMIGEGRKALQYHVRVSDVKLGGRILSGLDDEEIEIEDELDVVAGEEESGEENMEGMKGLLDVWSSVGRPKLDGTEGSGDRDSGIELERHLYSGRPPEKLASAPAIGNVAAAATQERSSRLPTLSS